MESKSDETIHITYVGFSDELILYLIDNCKYTIECVVTIENKLRKETISRINTSDIRLVYINCKNDLYNIRKLFYKKNVIMYKFGFIIPKEILEEGCFFNIHPGDLRTNRGAHPVRWTILLGEKESKITLYKVDGIDEGEVIEEIAISVDERDTYDTLNDKMESKFNILFDSFQKYLCGEMQGHMISDGEYRRKISGDDYLIEERKDTEKSVQRKINAMSDFSGAAMFFEGEKYRVNKIVEKNEMIEQNNKRIIQIELSDKTVSLLCEKFFLK